MAQTCMSKNVEDKYWHTLEIHFADAYMMRNYLRMEHLVPGTLKKKMYLFQKYIYFDHEV